MAGDRAQGTPDDYGYDLAHEIASDAGDSARRRARVDGERPHAPAVDSEPDGDYGYDEAHDL